MRMYRSGDLGETYPVARGSSPALVSLGGSLFAGEWMSPLGTVGIGLVCAGIFMLAAARARSAKEESGSASDRALQKVVSLHAMNLPAALATGVCIAGYTVIDGLGVRASGNWIAYAGCLFALFLVMAAMVSGAAPLRDLRHAVRGSGQGGERRGDFDRGLWRDHLGDAGESDGRGVGTARNQRGFRGVARSGISAASV